MGDTSQVLDSPAPPTSKRSVCGPLLVGGSAGFISVVAYGILMMVGGLTLGLRGVEREGIGLSLFEVLFSLGFPLCACLGVGLSIFYLYRRRKLSLPWWEPTVGASGAVLIAAALTRIIVGHWSFQSPLMLLMATCFAGSVVPLTVRRRQFVGYLVPAALLGTSSGALVATLMGGGFFAGILLVPLVIGLLVGVFALCIDLHLAAPRGARDHLVPRIVMLVVFAGVPLLWANLRQWSWSRATEVNAAVRSGNEAELAAMLEDDPGLANAADQLGSTPLHLAAGQGTCKAAEVLISRGADVNAKNRSGDTPLHRASSEGEADMVKLLLRHGADPSIRGIIEEMPLHKAASRGRAEAVAALLAGGAEIDAATSLGETALHLAAKRNRADVADLLLAKGADAGRGKKWTHETPLHVASEEGHTEVVAIFIKHKASLGVRDHAKRTPLHAAARTGRLSVVDLLLSNGADFNAKATAGRTPLSLATEQGHTKVAKRLREAGAEE